MRLITTAATLAFAGLLTLAGPAANAGEITGNGKHTPVKDHVAHSICSFSGLDDVDEDEDPSDPSTDDFGRTQNWGQIPSAVRSEIRSFAGPGVSCRGNVVHEE